MSECKQIYKSGKADRKFRYELSKMSDKEIEEMMDSVLSGTESDADSDFPGDFIDDEPIEVSEFPTISDTFERTSMVQDAPQEPGPSFLTPEECLLPQTGEALMATPTSFQQHLTYLRGRGIYGLGTIRSNRIPNCKLSTDKVIQGKAYKRGYMEEYVGTAYGVDITTILWKDTRNVRLASTYVGIKPFLTMTSQVQPQKISRYDRTNRKSIEVDCPRVIKEYNYHMGGVDLMDGLIGRYHIRLKTKSASLKLFYHFLDMAMVNAYLLYRRIHGEGCIIELPKFREQVASALCEYQLKPEKRAVGRPSKIEPKPIPSAIKRSYGLSLDARYDGIGHMPDQLDRSGKRTCKGDHSHSIQCWAQKSKCRPTKINTSEFLGMLLRVFFIMALSL